MTDSVETILEALVNHFSQPIHVKTGEDLEQFPHLDDDGAPQVITSPVTKHCLTQLLSIENQQALNDIIYDWICGYSNYVQPILKRQSGNTKRLNPSGVSVLEQYSAVLSSLLEHVEQDRSTSEESDNSHVCVTVETMARDVSVLTETASQFDEADDSQHKKLLATNIVIPTLLFIMSQSIPFVGDNNQVMQTCAVTLLAFGHAQMDPSLFFNVQDAVASILSFQDVSLNLSLDWLDCASVQLDGTEWDDANSGISTRAAAKCWNALLLVTDEDENESTINTNDDEEVKRNVLRQLGWKQMAAAVRAHFFGRDKHKTTVSKQQVWQYPLAQTSPPTVSFEERPSRVHVALQFIHLLNEKPLSTGVLQELLPIIYALLDSSQATNVAMGAAALLRVLTLVQSETLLKFQDTLLQVLNQALQSTREGSAIFLVALVSSRAFQILPAESIRVQRRQVTQEMLVTVSKNRHATSLQRGLLIGGIVPLLQQLSQEPNAGAMELGRLGLSTLLSLLHTYDTTIQGAALVALIYLFIGAYPIMPRHGGVIMSQLVACMGGMSLNESIGGDSSDGIDRVAVMTAAMALIICGEGADKMLQEIETKADEFEPSLIESVRGIRKEASRLKDGDDF